MLYDELEVKSIIQEHGCMCVARVNGPTTMPVSVVLSNSDVCAGPTFLPAPSVHIAESVSVARLAPL